MPAKAKVVPYSEKNYQRKREIYDVIAQCIEDIRYGTIHSAQGWNMLAERVKGITSKFLGEEHLQITYHRYEVGTVEELARIEIDKDGEKFIGEIIKELKRKFKQCTGKALTVKEVKVDQGLEKVSRLSAESSFLLSSSHRGSAGRPIGRYLIRTSVVYEFSANLEK